MIGGNITVQLQVSTSGKNKIGEMVPTWHDVPVYMPGKEEPGLFGFLDMQAGDSKYTTFNAKIQESTHVFLCDFAPIPDTLEVNGKTIRISAENTQIVANSQAYDVMLIDDPMGLHKHLEIFLKYTGGQ